MTELLQILTAFDDFRKPTLLGFHYEEQHYLITSAITEQNACLKYLKIWARKTHATIKCSYKYIEVRKNGNFLACIFFM